MFIPSACLLFLGPLSPSSLLSLFHPALVPHDFNSSVALAIDSPGSSASPLYHSFCISRPGPSDFVQFFQVCIGACVLSFSTAAFCKGRTALQVLSRESPPPPSSAVFLPLLGHSCFFLLSRVRGFYQIRGTSRSFENSSFSVPAAQIPFYPSPLL